VQPIEKRVWTGFFVGFGYLGAAVFYSYLIGINPQIKIACPATKRCCADLRVCAKKRKNEHKRY
jgi:hypothetical protein